MIEEEYIRFVAAADVTDDCRVEAEMRKRRQTLTATQARDFAAELVRAAGEAERAAAELARPVEPAGFDVQHISPDCRDGKHPFQPDTAWDIAADVEVPCDCACHWDTLNPEAPAVPAVFDREGGAR